MTVAGIVCIAFPLPTPTLAKGLVALGGKVVSIDRGSVGLPGGGSATVGTPTIEVLALVMVTVAIVAKHILNFLRGDGAGGGGTINHTGRVVLRDHGKGLAQ